MPDGSRRCDGIQVTPVDLMAVELMDLGFKSCGLLLFSVFFQFSFDPRGMFTAIEHIVK